MNPGRTLEKIPDGIPKELYGKQQREISRKQLGRIPERIPGELSKQSADES